MAIKDNFGFQVIASVFAGAAIAATLAVWLQHIEKQQQDKGRGR